MRIHHLNAATLHPVAAPRRARLKRGTMVTHCLLVELGSGLLLVDTGIGLLDVAVPLRRLGPEFLAWMAPDLVAAQTVVRQLEALGFDRSDVQQIALTHLDPDHAGGLADFPGAKVHVMAREYLAASSLYGRVVRRRYRPAQWAHAPRFELHEPTEPAWFGFKATSALGGLPAEVRLVSLPGHSRGHAGIAIELHGRWLLFTGDATLPHDEPGDNALLRSASSRLAAWGAPGVRERDDTAARLRALGRNQAGKIIMVSSHDPADLERCRRQGELSA
jgi:glyoxylase-like metal-dependent hydrolase (beta-lactamase superfamily II)